MQVSGNELRRTGHITSNLFFRSSKTAEVLSSSSEFSLEFISTMVQTLNLILLTAKELQGLRDILKRSFKANSATEDKEVFGGEHEGVHLSATTW